MPVKSPAPRHISEDIGNELIISIPSPKIWFVTIFTGFSLISWAFGEFLLLAWLISTRNGSERYAIILIIVILFIMMIGSSGYAIFNFAWQVTGKEVIEVRIQSITIHRVTLGISLPKEYIAKYIKKLRVSSSNIGLNPSMIMLYSIQTHPWSPDHNIGSLAFDYGTNYGTRTFRFGIGVDEAEAKQILVEIQQKYPEYKN